MSADFVSYTRLNGSGRYEWVDATAAHFKALGATYIRVSHPIDKPDNMFLEGWRVKPEHQGPHPWEACTYCGKPSSYVGPCGIGGCPIGADL